jgi:DNA-binding IscR family transcriptional regulator
MNTSSKFVVSVHILTLLAGRRYVFGEKGGLNSNDIALSVGTNPVVIRRLLSVMRTAGIVESRVGPFGGFYLKNHPRSINLSQVYDIVEDGSLYHLHYSKPSLICPVGGHIQESLSSILLEAEKSFKLALETESLQDMLDGIMQKVDRFQGMTKEELALEWDNTLELMNKECRMAEE